RVADPLAATEAQFSGAARAVARTLRLSRGGAAMTEHVQAQAHLEEHFGSLEQQEHAAHFGMWLFLTSEVLLFGALFGLYHAYRLESPEAFRIGTSLDNVALGTANTFILITSSLLAAWAVLATKTGKRRTAVLCLLGTLLLGALFLVFKLTEYAEH